MARYRKLDLRVWSDQKFRALSPLPPSGQSLWLILILGPQTTNIPGLFEASEVAMADRLGWSLEAFRKAFEEASANGMAKADWKARLVWLPNAPEYNKPESPNVVKSWGTTFDELPECALKWEAYQSLKAFTKGLKKAFAEAFDKAFPKPLPNQEQEQEQEQEQNLSGGNQSPPQTQKSEGEGKGSPTTPPPDLLEITDRCKKAYPAGTYTHANWILAEKALTKLIEEGETPDALVDAARQYYEQQKAKSNLGSQWVKSPEKFYGQGHWRGPFNIPVDLKRDAEIVWPLVRLAISNHDGRKSFGPETRAGAVVQQLGGWSALGMKDSKDIDFLKHDFVRLFMQSAAKDAA